MATTKATTATAKGTLGTVERPGSKRATTGKPAPKAKAKATAKPPNGNGKANGHSE